MRSFALALLAVTAAALRPSPAVRRPRTGHLQRSCRRLVAQDLPDGWAMDVDQTSGQTFYWNAHTGQSQWEPPQPQYNAPDLPAEWASGIDQASGTPFYYNEQTGQSQWERPESGSAPQGQEAQDSQPSTAPQSQVLWRVTSASGWSPRFAGKYNLCTGDEEVLGRYDMGLEKPYRPWVSRKQCSVQVRDDGTATLVSNGKPPTLWRERGGQWIALQNGDGLVLADGDQVSLDYNDPEGTVFNCQALLQEQR